MEERLRRLRQPAEATGAGTAGRPRAGGRRHPVDLRDRLPAGEAPVPGRDGAGRRLGRARHRDQGPALAAGRHEGVRARARDGHGRDVRLDRGRGLGAGPLRRRVVRATLRVAEGRRAADQLRAGGPRSAQGRGGREAPVAAARSARREPRGRAARGRGAPGADAARIDRGHRREAELAAAAAADAHAPRGAREAPAAERADGVRAGADDRDAGRGRQGAPGGAMTSRRTRCMLAVAAVLAGLAFAAPTAQAVPSVTFKCTPAPQDCSGWYRSNVTLDWTVLPTDASVVTGCQDKTFTADTPGTN